VGEEEGEEGPKTSFRLGCGSNLWWLVDSARVAAVLYRSFQDLVRFPGASRGDRDIRRKPAVRFPARLRGVPSDLRLYQHGGGEAWRWNWPRGDLWRTVGGRVRSTLSAACGFSDDCGAGTDLAVPDDFAELHPRAGQVCSASNCNHTHIYITYNIHIQHAQHNNKHIFLARHPCPPTTTARRTRPYTNTLSRTGVPAW